MRTGMKISCCFLTLVLLTGCWDAKVIQNLTYITAIGVDYVGDEYICYAQVSNISNIAKQESRNVGKQPSIWVAKGVGKTFTDALVSIYRFSQVRLFWGHIKSVVLSENAIRKGINPIFDMMNRYREIRYNIWVYGTNMPLDQVLIEPSIINLSPQESTLENPEEIYKQSSFIPPLYWYRLIALTKEPVNVAAIPSITISNKNWKENGKPQALLLVNGAYYLNLDHMAGWLSLTDLRGLRWLENQTVRTPLTATLNDKPIADLVVVKPRQSIKLIEKGAELHFDVTVKARAYVNQLHENVSEDVIEAQAAKIIEAEIKDTYKKGAQLGIDTLKLELYVYRNHPHKWNEIHDKHKKILHEHALDTVKVKVHIMHSGKFKQRVR
ncbi:Ger(x)C family spore germination protein [Paenibacillus albiflavus]|uniref:Ger(X)C family spore germination protein n=1 Tax=Paenibacillus albiflavus TaxID=2545760 RepID=A0A4R4E8B3_9BACL|nr:Ger(x)C family spore germination protein [Paenibacillus albiflavus]TCZ75193.1 Ger(x)C family spore germination protein [Paenibacillus albiflavus]